MSPSRRSPTERFLEARLREMGQPVPPKPAEKHYIRPWTVLRDVPALGLLAGDGLGEWTGTHTRIMVARAGRIIARLPDDAWPRVLEALGAGAVELETFMLPKGTTQAAVRGLVRRYGAARAVELVHQRKLCEWATWPATPPLPVLKLTKRGAK